MFLNTFRLILGLMFLTFASYWLVSGSPDFLVKAGFKDNAIILILWVLGLGLTTIGGSYFVFKKTPGT